MLQKVGLGAAVGLGATGAISTIGSISKQPLISQAAPFLGAIAAVSAGGGFTLPGIIAGASVLASTGLLTQLTSGAAGGPGGTFV